MLANLDKFQATAVHHNKNINEILNYSLISISVTRNMPTAKSNE